MLKGWTLFSAVGLLFALSIAPSANAQNEIESTDAPSLLFVLDLSSSMDERVADGHKLSLAVSAIGETYDELIEQGTSVEVIGYSGDCTGWPPTSVAAIPQVRTIEWASDSPFLKARGNTPTDLGLLSALYRMQIIDESMQLTGVDSGTIILISDGESNGCINPCDVARQFGAGRITVHSVGFDLAANSSAVQELACIARETGGVAVTVSDYQALQEEIAKLARLRVAVEFESVAAEGSSLQVRISTRNNISLDDAYLRISGPIALLESSPLEMPLGQLLEGDVRYVEFMWSANPCGSLSEIVEFGIGGIRSDRIGNENLIVEELAAINTVEEILLLGMTSRELRDRCSSGYTAAESNLLSSNTVEDRESGGTSNLVRYGGAGVVSLLAGMAVSHRRRSQATSQNAAGKPTQIAAEGYTWLSRVAEQGASMSSNPRVAAADKVINFSIKKVPVASAGVALALCAIENFDVGCVTCGATVVGASAGASALAGAFSVGTLAVPAAMLVGTGMQALWESGALNFLAQGVEGFVEGVTFVGNGVWEGGKSAVKGVGKGFKWLVGI